MGLYIFNPYISEHNTFGKITNFSVFLINKKSYSQYPIFGSDTVGALYLKLSVCLFLSLEEFLICNFRTQYLRPKSSDSVEIWQSNQL